MTYLYRFNLGWLIDTARRLGFSPDETQCLTIYSPIEMPDRHALLCRIDYECRTINYHVTYQTEVNYELIDKARIDSIESGYEKSLSAIAGHLPKIRQIERATKKIIGKTEIPIRTDRHYKYHDLIDASCPPLDGCVMPLPPLEWTR